MPKDELFDFIDSIDDSGLKTKVQKSLSKTELELQKANSLIDVENYSSAQEIIDKLLKEDYGNPLYYIASVRCKSKNYTEKNPSKALKLEMKAAYDLASKAGVKENDFLNYYYKHAEQPEDKFARKKDFDKDANDQLDKLCKQYNSHIKNYSDSIYSQAKFALTHNTHDGFQMFAMFAIDKLTSFSEDYKRFSNMFGTQVWSPTWQEGIRARNSSPKYSDILKSAKEGILVSYPYALGYSMCNKSMYKEIVPLLVKYIDEGYGKKFLKVAAYIASGLYHEDFETDCCLSSISEYGLTERPRPGKCGDFYNPIYAPLFLKMLKEEDPEEAKFLVGYNLLRIAKSGSDAKRALTLMIDSDYSYKYYYIGQYFKNKNAKAFIYCLTKQMELNYQKIKLGYQPDMRFEMANRCISSDDKAILMKAYLEGKDVERNFKYAERIYKSMGRSKEKEFFDEYIKQYKKSVKEGK